MATLGAWRALLAAVEEEARTHGHAAMHDVLLTGDLREVQRSGHVCQMYRWSQLEALVSSSGGRVVAASASNWASLGDPTVVSEIARDAQRWALFLDQEVDTCAEPGALDGGTHLLFAAVAGQGPTTDRIFHVTTRAEWDAAVSKGVYEVSTRGRTFAEVGFIHAALTDQLAAVAECVYADCTDELVVLGMSRASLEAVGLAVRFEDGGDGTLFPHIYGPLPCAVVDEVVPGLLRAGGRFSFSS
jgi:uncharacterized protein (DUF952 family)